MEQDRKIPVEVTISGFHASGEEDAEIKEVHDGYFSRRRESTYIIWEEPQGVKAMLKISEGKTEVKKSLPGASNSVLSSLSYEKGKSLPGFYHTPYGRLDIETFTKETVFKEQRDSFRVDMKGSIKMNGSPVSDFNLKIVAAVKI